MSKVQTIEKTSKRFKAFILVGWALIFVGVLGVVADTAAVSNGITMSAIVLIFPLAILLGIVTLIVTKILIWWNHG